MPYMGDPRENCFDFENHTVWESDNRKEARYVWNGAVLDLCDLPVEEYMKNPIISAIESNGSSSSGNIDEILTKIDEINDKIEESTSEIVDAISASGNIDDILVKIDEVNENINESTDKIVEAIGSISGVTPQTEIIYYYASINNKTQPTSLTLSDFSIQTIAVESESFFTYVLGDPTQENWEKFLNNEITEEELVDLSNNDFYLLLPNPYAVNQKFVLLEEGLLDVTSDFSIVDTTIKEGYTTLRSHDEDHFNRDYPDETHVKLNYKIKVLK